jgi:hypothetical protein
LSIRVDILLLVSAITNTEQPSTTSTREIWFPKLSKSEQTAYSKDISRLRSIVKPKNRSNNSISIGEIHALIRNSHAIRRRALSQKGDVDFNTKVLEYQEIFHEEAVRKVVSCSFFISLFSISFSPSLRLNFNPADISQGSNIA